MGQTSHDQINDQIKEDFPAAAAAAGNNPSVGSNNAFSSTDENNGKDGEDDAEGTHYYDPGTPLPLTTTTTQQDNSQVRSHPHHGTTSSNHNDEDIDHRSDDRMDWWKDYFPHHGTWDDPSEVHGDAQMINHIPWNAMFPKNSYLPDDHLLNNQHHSYMGTKFHHSYDGHNPKENPGHLRETASVEEGDEGDSIHPEDTLVGHDLTNPYGHNTPYLGGSTINEGSNDVFSSVHGDLCVEKRDAICTGRKPFNINYRTTLKCGYAKV